MMSVKKLTIWFMMGLLTGNLFAEVTPLKQIKGSGERARVMVLADMGHDPDEEQQMVHFISCSSEFEVEGLIAVTGLFFRRDPSLVVKDLRPHLFHEIIDAYEKVLPNLKLHASGWQEAEALRKIIARGQEGNGLADTGKGKGSAGSRLIVAALKKGDDRPLNIIVNAGANTLAQALIDLQADSTQEEFAQQIAKLRVFDNGGQDECGAWICREYPSILYVRSTYVTKAYGGPTRKMGPHVWKPFDYTAEGQHAWAKEHIQTKHGALGAVYPDRAVGGRVHFLEGGGTVPFMGFVSRGLSDSAKPYWGGWSGRFSRERLPNPPSYHWGVKEEEKAFRPYSAFADPVTLKDRWTDSSSGESYHDVYTTVWRWREAMWNDLRCRMDWCVAPYEKANHHPRAVVNGDDSDTILTVDLKGGAVLVVDASGSTDPDGDSLNYSWFIYPEAGTCKELVKISHPKNSKTEIHLPENVVGSEIHLILEVTDDKPIGSLSDYRRIVIHVK